MTEFPWPRKGDKLITSDGGMCNACIDARFNDWHVYAAGYRHAADILVNQVETGMGYQDLLVYPVGFLYRQYIELELKGLIRHGSKLLDQPESPPADHRLHALWAKCRKILQRAFPEEPEEDFDAMEALIDQLVAIDPTSEAFRYPLSKKGERSLNGVTHINLKHLSHAVAKMAGFFDGAGAKVSEFLDIRDDMLGDAW